MNKILKNNSLTLSKINKLEDFLNENGLRIEISKNPSRGLIITDTDAKQNFTLKDQYNRFSLPLFYEDVLVLSDENGNPIEF